MVIIVQKRIKRRLSRMHTLIPPSGGADKKFVEGACSLKSFPRCSSMLQTRKEVYYVRKTFSCLISRKVSKVSESSLEVSEMSSGTPWFPHCPRSDMRSSITKAKKTLFWANDYKIWFTINRWSSRINKNISDFCFPCKFFLILPCFSFLVIGLKDHLCVLFLCAHRSNFACKCPSEQLSTRNCPTSIYPATNCPFPDIKHSKKHQSMPKCTWVVRVLHQKIKIWQKLLKIVFIRKCVFIFRLNPVPLGRWGWHWWYRHAKR
jgi:hypothetical protein